ncbi:MAG: ribbon-helix-helix protein, CopG family [Verrucomicrobia bacterium]|nr:ribbon-helix-helix protein, CopG family [Verrucomicrobiota bacterium]
MACIVYDANMIRTQIQFEKKTYEKLKAKSKASGASISEIVRRSLDTTIEKHEAEEKWARAFQSLGKFESGLRNLSEKHDEHLGSRW